MMCKHEESMYGRCVACGMTWEEQAKREARRQALAQYPIGATVATEVHSLGGRVEIVSGQVIAHKFGELRVSTEYHGVLCVLPDKVTAPAPQRNS